MFGPLDEEKNIIHYGDRGGKKRNLKIMARMKVKAGTRLLMAEASVGEL